MTHADIKKKFLIEYDKENVTSSYPSLTDYEIATILDKAYLAIIAQKLTGNNQRGSAFENDVKAISDVRGLLTTTTIPEEVSTLDNGVTNKLEYIIPENLLYYIQSNLRLYDRIESIDENNLRIVPVTLINHTDAVKFFATSNNTPWIETPVCYIENNILVVLYDKYEFNKNKGVCDMHLTYIHEPKKFVDDYDTGNLKFELNDSMAEELINLAIVMATEVVQSSRLNTKIQTRTLES